MTDPRPVVADAPPFFSRFMTHLHADPQAVAMRCDDRDWSYAQLNAAVLAHFRALRAEAAGPEDVVALVAERSPDYVAMMLGVLRAGAAFLPIEPTTPAERAQLMCRTTQARTVLAAPPQLAYAKALLPQLGADARLLAADPAPGPAMIGPPVARVPQGLAYVIFTSGSTGVPKGAMVVDRGMNNHLLAKEIDLQLTAADVIGLTAPLSFDISIWQALNGLYVGGSVAVASAKNLAEPVELMAWVERHGVTILEIVPSYLAVILDLVPHDLIRRQVRSVRRLIATGEALPMALAERWYRTCPEIPLVNAYGPTECSDDVTHHVLTVEECRTRVRPPIGREVINTRLHILDEAGAPVPDGTEGEVYVSGLGVGRGYFAAPGRTALAFLPDYLSGNPGVRLYRTGDRGVRLADGTIDYLGRRDRQVKIHGHRIELGEVEAQLLRVPGVSAAAAIVTADRLRGFVTLSTEAEQTQDAAAIRDAMRQACPRYLVPQEIVILAEMPTGVNGKIDYHALTGLAEAPAGGPAGGAEDLARQACRLVAGLLDLPSIAADADFFMSGGDSLSAMKLMALARERFRCAGLALQGFLDDPTPRGLAMMVQRARAAGQDNPTPPPPTEALSSGEERLWFLEQLNDSANSQLIRLQLGLEGALNLKAMQHALDALIARHEPLRTTYSQKLGVPKATVWPEARLPLAFDRDPGDAVWRKRIDAAQMLADAKAPPLGFAHLTETAPDRYVLRLILNHLIADGWSLQIIGEEISRYYRGWIDGARDIEPVGPTYRAYAAAERQWLKSDEEKTHVAFWSAELADIAAAGALPLDRPRANQTDWRTAYVSESLSAEETAALGRVARGAKATPFMVVMAGFYAALREAAGAADLVIGVDSANRSWPGGDRLVGNFVNQLPVRLNLADGSLSLGEAIRAARAKCLAAYRHERLPFHRMVAIANPPREANRFPLFQVKLTQQGGWRSSLDLPGLRVTPANLPEPTMPLDLMLDVSGETDALQLELLYRPQILDRETAARWLDRLVAMLRHGIADPGAPLAAAQHSQTKPYESQVRR